MTSSASTPAAAAAAAAVTSPKTAARGIRPASLVAGIALALMAVLAGVQVQHELR